jgi:hypothetical protein
MLRRASPRVAVVVGYCLAAIAFTWPLALHLGTAFTGDPAGDTGVYVWNQWVFQHEALVERRNPLQTEQILSLTQRVDLSQHNYTASLDLLALPLLPWLGVVRTFNIVFLAATVLTALATYALARRATPATRPEAWLAGLAFAWSPVLVARSTGHFSLVAAAPLACFLLCLINADRSRRPRDAALAGASMALAGFSDAYYAIYCLIIATGYVASRVVRVGRAETPARAPWRWGVNILIMCVAGLVVSLLFGPGRNLNVLGMAISVRGLYTPVLVLTFLCLVRLALQLRPTSISFEAWSPSAARAILVGILACAGPLSPVLYGLGTRMIDGRYVDPPTLWRSSPRGVDFLGLVEPNPNHPAVRWFDDRQATDGAAFVEYTAAMSLVALLVVGLAVWRAGYRPRAGWLALTAGFAALALGPFVFFAGVNTYVPGPWAVLRYLPLIGAARTPTRFAVVAALGLAILLAGALAALGRRYPQRRRLITAVAGLCLAIELLPAPRTLYSAEIPEIYRIIAADARDVRILQLPFGVRDGVSSSGNFTALYQYFQTLHGKKLIGGYLSRISTKRVGEVRAQPTLGALLTMSEGGQLSPEQAAVVRQRGPMFVTRAKLGYVVIDRARTPAHLRDLVIEAWALREIARDETRTLYRPTVGAVTAQ